MYSSKIVRDIAGVGLLIAILHRGAITSSWYWQYWWMDVIMHFLGGLFVGLVALWFFYAVLKKPPVSFRMFGLVLGFVLLISVGWEIFEYAAGVFILEDPFPDTFHDLILDTFGGVVAYVYGSAALQEKV